MLTTQDLRGHTALEKPTPLLLEVLGKRKGGPSVPRTPTSPMELVGGWSHPLLGLASSKGMKKEGQMRERRERAEREQESEEREREKGESKRQGWREKGRKLEHQRQGKTERPREATGNWKRERDKGKRDEERRGKTEVRERETEHYRREPRERETDSLAEEEVPSPGGNKLQEKQLGQEVTACSPPLTQHPSSA